MSWLKKIWSRTSPQEETLSQETSLEQGLQKTRSFWGSHLKRLLLGKKQVDRDLLEAIENALLEADVGIGMTQQLLTPLEQGLDRHLAQNSEEVLVYLKTQLSDRLSPLCQPLSYAEQPAPFVILAVGVNGAGKTTTIAKLARLMQLQGKKVMMAAGDTFRAAAVEQLQQWGQRYDIPVVAQETGSDSAAVIFDACQSAKAKGIDIVLADTAGRLHTQDLLMDELKKIKRVLTKIDSRFPQETLLVLDAGIGQNAIRQVKQFHEAVGVTGLAMTKLDGTAKGGVVFALADAFSLPLRYIGVGEAVGDLRTFDADAFVEAIFHDDSV